MISKKTKPTLDNVNSTSREEILTPGKTITILLGKYFSSLQLYIVNFYSHFHFIIVRQCHPIQENQRMRETINIYSTHSSTKRCQYSENYYIRDLSFLFPSLVITFFLLRFKKKIFFKLCFLQKNM